VIADRPEVLDELKHCGVTGIGVSIDGLPHTHDAFRQCHNGFIKAFNAARWAVESGYAVTVSMVVHRGNVAELPTLYEVVKREIRPRYFRVMTLDPIGRAAGGGLQSLTAQEFRFVMQFLQREYSANCVNYADPRTTMVELGCGGWMGRSLEGRFRPFVFHCIAGIVNLGILYDGKLAACSNISRDFIEGDLRKGDRIRDVWENRYQRYRECEWKRTGACLSCDEWAYCSGGPMHKMWLDGSRTDCLLQLDRKGGECVDE